MLKESKDKNKNLNSDAENSEDIKMELSLPEQYENIVSDVQKEIMNEELEEFAPIKENDINISTTYIYDDGEELEAKIYFRNGFTNKINFEYVPLIIINSKGEVLANKTFDLREMGDIPPFSARPWKVYFDKSEIDMNKFSPEDCKVIFDSKIKAVNYANIELEPFDEPVRELRPVFEAFLNTLPSIEKGKLSFSTFKIELSDEGQIIVTLLVRNASDKTIKLEEIPVILKDENNNIAASGRFVLNNFQVSAMKAKPFALAFDTELNLNESTPFDKWSVVFESL
jgi:SLAP domain-containing protein